MTTQIRTVYICPNCKEPIIIDQFKCGEFIHPYYKKTMKPVNPHTKIIRKNKIIGCGFKFTIKSLP